LIEQPDGLRAEQDARAAVLEDLKFIIDQVISNVSVVVLQLTMESSLRGQQQHTGGRVIERCNRVATKV